MSSTSLEGDSAAGELLYGALLKTRGSGALDACRVNHVLFSLVGDRSSKADAELWEDLMCER
eukprot:14609223-Alexandrium_andersonii.AAC.1